MSSPPKEKEEPELKGGHAPAVKVAGGVRIKQHKPPSHQEEVKDEGDEEMEPERPNPNDEHQIIISGAAVKGDKDFTPKALKAFHEKPMAAKQPSHSQQHHNIQQPKK